jgi:hypothetical protein
MLINKNFRAKVVEYVTDPIVKRFWVEEFAGYTDRYTQEATPAIQNKIGQFASNPLVRNIIAQPKSSFDIRYMMDNNKILVVNLSKGRMGEQNADLLGSMLTTKIYLAAMSRAEEPPTALAKLPPFYLYVDEFQSVVNDSFRNILSEARKYKLSLTIAHQYIEQVEEEIRAAVFGNVGTTIAFRVGPFDAETLKTVFEPTFYAEDLVNLGFAQVYLTLMIDGIGSKPFSATTLPPVENPPANFTEQIIESSRRQFTHSRAEIEKMIRGEDENIPPGGFENLNKRRNEQKKVHKKRKKAREERVSEKVQRPKVERIQKEPTHEEKKASSIQKLQGQKREEEQGDDKRTLREALAAIAKRNESEKQTSAPHLTSSTSKPQKQHSSTREVPREVLEKVLHTED